jgi:hypothetical protein
VTKLEHSPDLAQADFYLFRLIKLALKGWRFCDVIDIKNATEELKRLSQNGFHECFQNIYIRWQKSIVAQGNILKEM